MNQNGYDGKALASTPVAKVKSGHSFSIIWVVPIIALLVGLWLGVKSWSEKGPVITIRFATADGLVADETKIKFNDVEIGYVSKIELSEDLNGVIVTAEMQKEASKFMRKKTQFWVVRARVAAGEVTGLNTLFSGAYIGCSPSVEGGETSSFKGLEKPPVIVSGMPGRHFILESATLGSLDVGSPVYYRGIKVGQVVDYGFNEQAEAVNVRVFINAPYDQKVRENTRFWNASGLDFRVDTEGVSVDTQSLLSIILGGVAFDMPEYLEPVTQAQEDSIFPLYKSVEKVEERVYQLKRYYLMYFDQNVRGLAPGAPVEIRGIRIGEVVDVKLEVNIDDVAARVAVLTVIEPERIDSLLGGLSTNDAARPTAAEAAVENIALLVEKGLRAQLKSANLLTGQLYVDLEFYPGAERLTVQRRNGYLVMPTLPAPIEQITQRVNNILTQIEKMPLEEIGLEMHKTIKALHETLAAAERVAGKVDADLLPKLKQALDEFQATMAAVEQTLGPDSALDFNARALMNEMTGAVRSLRALIDSVEQNPQSILFGKEAEK